MSKNDTNNNELNASQKKLAAIRSEYYKKMESKMNNNKLSLFEKIGLYKDTLYSEFTATIYDRENITEMSLNDKNFKDRLVSNINNELNENKTDLRELNI